MKLRILVLMIILLTATGSALEAYEYETYSDGNRTEVFNPGDPIEFKLNVSDNQDYNITAYKDSDFLFNDRPMNQTGSGFHKLYWANSTVSNNATGGEWQSFVNLTLNRETTFVRESFQVATDNPRIFYSDAKNVVPIGENFTVTINTSDSQANWQDATVDTRNGELQLEEIGNTSNTKAFQINFEPQDEGFRTYTVEVTDQNGNSDTVKITIEVTDGSDAGNISIKVGTSCQVNLPQFFPPGNGTLFYGEFGYFTQRYVNVGSFVTNLTVQFINVTYEGSDQWEPGEALGEQFKYYNGTNLTLNETEDGVYQEYFNYTTNQSANNTAKPGFYTGRTEYNYTCANGAQKSTTDYANFRIVNTTGGVSTSGNQSTNQTIPSNVTDIVDQTESDVPSPAETTTKNASANNTVPGDSPAPGETQVPEPEPEPEPEPDPLPLLSLDIESVQRTYSGRRGQAIPAELEIVNEGDLPLTDVTVSPRLSQYGEGWTSTNASIANISANETVTREIFITPPATADPGTYVVPIVGENPENELDVDYFTLEVTQDPVFTSRLQVVEAPRTVSLTQNTTQQLPLLLRNNGEAPLTNISGQLQNIDDCGSVEFGNIENLSVNGTQSLAMNFSAGMRTETCNSTLIVSSEEGAYGFARMTFEIRPREGLIPEEYRVPFIAFAWTGLLAIAAVLKRRFELDSALFKAPFVMMVMGETLIFLYLVVDYYQLASVAFLPF